jgi:hypothetical protein
VFTLRVSSVRVLSAGVHACMYQREREGQRERDGQIYSRASLSLCIYVYMRFLRELRLRLSSAVVHVIYILYIIYTYSLSAPVSLYVRTCVCVYIHTCKERACLSALPLSMYVCMYIFECRCACVHAHASSSCSLYTSQ